MRRSVVFITGPHNAEGSIAFEFVVLRGDADCDDSPTRNSVVLLRRETRTCEDPFVLDYSLLST